MLSLNFVCTCAVVKNPPANARDAVFLPGKSHGQRSLAGYIPQGRKELDTTEVI